MKIIETKRHTVIIWTGSYVFDKQWIVVAVVIYLCVWAVDYNQNKSRVIGTNSICRKLAKCVHAYVRTRNNICHSIFFFHNKNAISKFLSGQWIERNELNHPKYSGSSDARINKHAIQSMKFAKIHVDYKHFLLILNTIWMKIWSGAVVYFLFIDFENCLRTKAGPSKLAVNALMWISKWTYSQASFCTYWF